MGSERSNKSEEPKVGGVQEESAYEGRRPVGRSSVDKGAMTPIGHGGAAAPPDSDAPDAKSRRWEGGGKKD
jgi:hypothetical protein